MDNFFALFRRYLNDKAKGNAVYVKPAEYFDQTTRLGSGMQTDKHSDTATGTELPLPHRARW